MKRTHKGISILLASAMLLTAPAALAGTVTFDGTVEASETREVYAPIGGTVESVAVKQGEQVSAGDTLYALRTSKVYAEESGTVTAVFAAEGDSADTVARKYGGVVVLEGESVYTVNASTEKAYDSAATKFVHVGEEVLIECSSDGDHTGNGIITAVTGTDYTVEVRSGEFLLGENVSIYRKSVKAANRIGKGDIARKAPTSVSGTGSIVSLAVKPGDTVARGDLLFETLSGTFDGYCMTGSEIKADVAGTVAQLNLVQGGMAQKDAVCAVIYPENAMRIRAQINECDLCEIAVGDPVEIELAWNQDEEITYDGTISMISAIASPSQAGMGGTMFDVYIDFTPDASTRYGMNATVSTLDKKDAAEAEEDAEAEEAAEGQEG